MIKGYLLKSRQLKIENYKMKIADSPYSMHVGLSVESSGVEFAICIFQFSFCNAFSSLDPVATAPGTDTVVVTQK